MSLPVVAYLATATNCSTWLASNPHVSAVRLFALVYKQLVRNNGREYMTLNETYLPTQCSGAYGIAGQLSGFYHQPFCCNW